MEKRYFKRLKTKLPLKKKKEANKAHSPKLYRFLTDLRLWVVIASVVLWVFIGFASVELFHNLEHKKQLENKQKQLYTDIRHWQEMAVKYPESRDVYFRLAVLEYQVGAKAKAKEYIEKVLEFDPNFKEGRSMEKLLSK